MKKEKVVFFLGIPFSFLFVCSKKTRKGYKELFFFWYLFSIVFFYRIFLKEFFSFKLLKKKHIFLKGIQGIQGIQETQGIQGIQGIQRRVFKKEHSFFLKENFVLFLFFVCKSYLSFCFKLLKSKKNSALYPFLCISSLFVL